MQNLHLPSFFLRWARIAQPPPTLCVKLFDDRFVPVKSLDPQSSTHDIRLWWAQMLWAENYVRTELAAYNKLEFMQGSLIPRFYGAHSVSCVAFTFMTA